MYYITMSLFARSRAKKNREKRVSYSAKKKSRILCATIEKYSFNQWILLSTNKNAFH